MKKPMLFVLLLAFCLSGNSQTLIFEEYFDGGGIPAA